MLREFELVQAMSGRVSEGTPMYGVGAALNVVYVERLVARVGIELQREWRKSTKASMTARLTERLRGIVGLKYSGTTRAEASCSASVGDGLSFIEIVTDAALTSIEDVRRVVLAHWVQRRSIMQIANDLGCSKAVVDGQLRGWWTALQHRLEQRFGSKQEVVEVAKVANRSMSFASAIVSHT